MQATRQPNKRYSMAFKQKVVSEIESGKFTITGVKHLYDITGGTTIHRWIRKLGKSHLINHTVRIEMKHEHDKLKALEREKRELESALAQAHLKIIVLESTINVLEEGTGTVLKKSADAISSPAVLLTPTSETEDTR